ncbi:hypothetical protein L2E82_42863 [Cichorium intybus]|uniref:Uncharacterized protein n=1 Tax=Cichorium intybus TaxID=13427 RepID=A0ACB8ZMW2_CICIN|nr:hypothetical protein L2E82_42863 [Cichorium intybus]
MAIGSSSEPKPGSPSFFKVVRYPSAPHLSLPIAFVRRYLDKIPKNPTLKTATGEHSWRLTFKKIGEDYCFAHGWEKLAKDAELRIRDILVFWLIDSFTFQVSFFDEHGCDKDPPLNNTGDGDEDDGDYDDDDDDDVVTPDEDLYFQKVISLKNHKYYMVLPKKFLAWDKHQEQWRAGSYWMALPLYHRIGTWWTVE